MRTLEFHGLSRIREYHVWGELKSRCLNKSHRVYSDYGGRGITVCERWNKFSAFMEDMGLRPTPRHTIERIDNDGPYSKENCRWATYKDQQRNKRSTRFVMLNGVSKSLAAWVDELGSNRNAVDSRLRRGWSEKDALTTPYHPGRWHKRP